MGQDIHVRNRYKKEIDILIKRLHILQEQEKSYKNLSGDIDKLKNELKGLRKVRGDLDKQIDKKMSVIAEIGAKNQELISEGEIIQAQHRDLKKKIDKEREDYIKQKDIYNNHLDKIHETITKTNLKKEDFNNKMLEVKKEYEILVDKIKKDKGDLFDKVLNNERVLEEQEEKKLELEKEYNNLKKDYGELDTEYQKLLENYITKT